MIKFRYVLIAVAFLAFRVDCFAQASGGDLNSVQTTLGPLVISKIDHGRGPETYNIGLAGRDFDKLYGMRYMYYAESGSSDKPNARVLMEDFIGGASDMPSISLYDFRGKSAEIFPVTDNLDVEDVRWTRDSVLLQSGEIWYEYKRGKLYRLRAKPH